MIARETGPVNSAASLKIQPAATVVILLPF